MTSNAGKLISEWGKPDKRVEAHYRRRKWIIIGVISAIVIFLAYLILNNMFGMIFRPVTSLSSFPQGNDWAMFGRNPLHTGALNAAGTLPEGTVKAFLSTGAEINSSPVVAGGTVYIGSRDHFLYAVDAATGALRWKFEAGSWIESSPAVVNNTVYVGSNDGKLYALAADSGKKLWEYSTHFVVRSSPAVAGSKVYFGSNDYSLHAVDTATGKQAWSVNTGTDVLSSPVVSDGIVYVGTGEDYFYMVDALHGTVRNRYNAYKPVVSSPAVKDGVVYFANSDGYFYAIDGKSKNWLFENKIRPMWAVLYVYGGAPKPPAPSGYLWSVQLGAPSISSPTISGNRLYIGSDRGLTCIDLQTQGIAWTVPTPSWITTMPLVAGNLVYATSANGHLYVFDASTGNQLKDIAVAERLSTSPAISGSTIFISAPDGKVYTIN